MPPDHRFDVRGDPRYAGLAPDVVPATECLADVVVRLLPYWYDALAPDVLAGRTVLVAAHGNSLRALIKHLEGISDADITELEIPTGVPIVYELDGRLAVTAGGSSATRRHRRRRRGRPPPGRPLAASSPGAAARAGRPAVACRRSVAQRSLRRYSGTLDSL